MNNTPYYLIERNDRGAAEWLCYSARPPSIWTTDAHAAERFSSADIAYHEWLDHAYESGIVVTITEHVDVGGPQQR